MTTRRALLTAGAGPWLIPRSWAADTPRFALGVASGQPRADGMVLWTRLTGTDLPTRVDVQWELAHDEGFARVAARGVELAEAAWAHSVHAEPGGLEPGRWYWYRFQAQGQRSRIGRTRTAPAADATASLRLALASCQRWDHGHYAAWRHLARQDLDLVAFVGDYIYEYPSSPTALRRHSGGLLLDLDGYRERYAQYKSDPALQDAHAACPWLLTWDDHEVANDYAGTASSTPLGLDLARLRTAAYQAWWEHQPLAKAQRPQAGVMRLYDRLDWGRLARVHLLDDRQYRDVQACPPLLRSSGSRTLFARDCAALNDPARTLLGREQEQWLAQGWSLDRPWNLLAQQTLMARFSSDPAGRYWTDGWDGYPAARARLLGAAAERRVPGLVVLGGDVHAHNVADLKVDFDDARGAVIGSEFCSTSISSHGRSQATLDKALPLNPHMHLARSDVRGAIVLDVQAQQLQARLLAVDDPTDAGSPVRELARFVVDPKQPGPQRA